jgi:hypothetical protein
MINIVYILLALATPHVILAQPKSVCDQACNADSFATRDEYRKCLIDRADKCREERRQTFHEEDTKQKVC